MDNIDNFVYYGKTRKEYWYHMLLTSMGKKWVYQVSKIKIKEKDGGPLKDVCVARNCWNQQNISVIQQLKKEKKSEIILPEIIGNKQPTKTIKLLSIFLQA